MRVILETQEIVVPAITVFLMYQQNYSVIKANAASSGLSAPAGGVSWL
jgi:hypothetical protein